MVEVTRTKSWLAMFLLFVSILFDAPNIKKLIFLYKWSQIKPHKALQCITQAFLLFSLSASHNSVIDRKLDSLCLWKKLNLYKNHNMKDSLFFVFKSIYSNYISFVFFLWGIYNWKIYFPSYSPTPQTSTNDSLNTACFREFKQWTLFIMF